ncbi:UNVERIFIED_CONTAM: hypothetical protein K2H54_003587 [Gekko kuhli]
MIQRSNERTHGANEDCVDGENRTPLHWAAVSGCASSVLLLCDQEAFLDVTDNNGQTPLMVAAQGNHPAICSQLLQRGAKVDLTDKDGKTALILACESSSMESAELLLQNGANVGLIDNTGLDALRYATQTKSRPLKRLLRSALKKWKKRESGFDCSSEVGSQIFSESGKDTDVSSLTLQSERGEDSDDEDEEENAELKEWRSRYREEKMKVIQLELQLAQKTKECVGLSEGCKSIKERVWDQVQEINQLLPEGSDNSQDWEELSKRYSCDLSEEDYYLSLLAEQVQELKRRKNQHEEQEKQHVETQTVEEEPKSVVVQQEGVRWPGEEEEEEKKQQQMELWRLQAEVAAAVEEKTSAAQRVQEMEGHMENMRAVISVYETKKKSQSGALKALEARVTELDVENQQLRGLLAKNLGETETLGKQDTGFPRDKISQFFTEMEEEYSRVLKENSIILTENEALKKEADEAMRINLQFQAVPTGTVRRSVAVWKKVVTGLENALAKLEQVNSRLLEKVRPLREVVLASQSGVMVNGMDHQEKELEKLETGKNQLHEEISGQVKLRVKTDRGDNKSRSSRRSSDLEKEVWDLKQNNGSLVKELAQLSREREKLQEELHRLFHPKEEPPQQEATGSLVVEELKKTVDSLSQQLLDEKEESKRLQMKLETQKKEMLVVRDSFLKQMTKEVSNTGNENLGNSILRELHWKLDNVVKKQNEALQLVSEMEEESHAFEADRTHFADHNGLSPFSAEEKAWREMYAEASDAIADNWKVRQRMNELEKGLQELKELYEAAQASLLGRGEEGATMKQLIDRLTIKMAELRHEEEEALRKHEKVRGMLSLRAQALGEQLSALQEKHEKASGESIQHKEALTFERQRNKELLAEAAEHEEEVDELRGKSQRLEISVDKLNRKVEELTKTCQDREGRIKKLLKETEKLSSEVLNLRSERARLHLQIEVIQKNHQEIVSIYRTHLLNAAQGFMDEEVHAMLLRILRTDG